jgi:hypothetical protein
MLSEGTIPPHLKQRQADKNQADGAGKTQPAENNVGEQRHQNQTDKTSDDFNG